MHEEDYSVSAFGIYGREFIWTKKSVVFVVVVVFGGRLLERAFEI